MKRAGQHSVDERLGDVDNLEGSAERRVATHLEYVDHLERVVGIASPSASETWTTSKAEMNVEPPYTSAMLLSSKALPGVASPDTSEYVDHLEGASERHK